MQALTHNIVKNVKNLRSNKTGVNIKQTIATRSVIWSIQQKKNEE